MGSSQTTLQSELETVVGDNHVGLIILSIVLILAGIAAIAFPYVSTLSMEFFIGWLLVFTGISQMLHSLQARARGGFLWVFLVGVLESAVGVALLVFPLAGTFTLTVFLAMTFILEGFFRAALAVQIKPMSGWGWVLLGGFLSIFIGGLLYAELPSSALWAIGLMVGINVTMSGLALLMLAMAAGASKTIDTQPTAEADAETSSEAEAEKAPEPDEGLGQDEKKDTETVAEANKDIAPETETDKTSELNKEDDKDTNVKDTSVKAASVKATSVETDEEKTPEVESEKTEPKNTPKQDSEKSTDAVVKADEKVEGEAAPKAEGEAETEKTSKPNENDGTQKDADEVVVKVEDTRLETDLKNDTDAGADADVGAKTEVAPEAKEDVGEEANKETDKVKDEEKAPKKDPQAEA